MAKTARYPIPEQKIKEAKTVTIKNWWAREDDNWQYTEYRGTAKDLQDAGIVPERMFLETGKSGTKSGRIIYPDGKEWTIRINRTGKEYWKVLIYHPMDATPYQSSLAKCSTENGRTRETEETKSEELHKRLGFRPYGDPSRYDGRINSWAILDSIKEKILTVFEGTRKQLINAGIATDSMFPNKRNKKTGECEVRKSYFTTEDGEDLYIVWQRHPIFPELNR